MKRVAVIFILIWVAVLVIGSVRDVNFWLTPDQRGDLLSKKGRLAEAVKIYADPWRLGTAQYRNGDFEAAAKTFARVPGATGAFDAGNAWLMHGKYDDAITSYDRALSFHPHWREAEENKALALARKAALEASAKDRDQEQTDSNDEEDTPDAITFDQKGDDQKGQPTELAGGEMSDEALRATWLRRVQTTPGDFLRAKFAYQATKKKEETK